MDIQTNVRKGLMLRVKDNDMRTVMGCRMSPIAPLVFTENYKLTEGYMTPTQ